MNLHMVVKLQCAITTLNTRLTHGIETENKGQKLGIDYSQKKEHQHETPNSGIFVKTSRVKWLLVIRSSLFNMY